MLQTYFTYSIFYLHNELHLGTIHLTVEKYFN